MIKDKSELKEYLLADSIANKRKKNRPGIIGDEVWKYIRTMRYLDYYSYRKSRSALYVPLYFLYKYRFHKLGVLLGFSIPCNVIGKGISIAHYGSIVINDTCTIGENCRIHVGVCIGAANGNPNAPSIGNNVYIGAGAKIIGDIDIADDVAIGAGAVVTKSITESGTTWAGVPARKISENGSATSYK